MAFIKADRVKEQTSSVGTGAMTLAGALTQYRTFASQMADGDEATILILHSLNEWEICWSTYSLSANQMSRGTILSSSNVGNTRVNFSAGVKAVSLIYPAANAVTMSSGGDAGVSGDFDVGGALTASTYNGYVPASADDLTAKPSARVATAAALPACTYDNGVSDDGVGATLTADASGALTIDSVAVADMDIVLVKDQADAAQNGLYVVTDKGDASNPFILTRHTACDEAEDVPNAFVPVGGSGSGNANTLWMCNPATMPPVIGTTDLEFDSVTAGLGFAPLDSALNLSDVASVSTARTNLGLSTVAATGSAADLTGQMNIAQLPALISTRIFIGNASNLAAALPISGDAVLANTGALTVTKTNGSPFVASAITDTTNASNIISGNLSISRMPQIASNTVLANTTGGVAVAAATTMGTLMDMLGTTQGSVLYRGASGWTSLGPGTAGQVLQTNGTSANPSWATASGGSGSGTVNSGTTGQLAYYAASGTAVSGTTALPNGTTATTQDAGDNSTKVATTEYVDERIANGPAGADLEAILQEAFASNKMAYATRTTYTVSTPIVIEITSDIEGPVGFDGRGCRINSTITNGDPVITVKIVGSGVTASVIQFRNFSMYGNGDEGDGLYIEQPDGGDSTFYNVLIDNVNVAGMGGYGIQFIGRIKESNLYNCWMTGNVAGGASMGNGYAEDRDMTAVRWYGGGFRANVGAGIYMSYGADDLSVYGAYFVDNAAYGIVAQYGLNLVQGCGFENNDVAGVYFDKYANVRDCTFITDGTPQVIGVEGVLSGSTPFVVIDGCNIVFIGTPPDNTVLADLTGTGKAYVTSTGALTLASTVALHTSSLRTDPMIADAYTVTASNLNDQTGTTYTLLSSDNGKVVTLNNASAVTVTLPSGLTAGFSCTIYQKGAGQVTLSPSSTTLNSLNGLKTAGQYAFMTVTYLGANTYGISGDVTT